jgi:hypothetical protein
MRASRDSDAGKIIKNLEISLGNFKSFSCSLKKKEGDDQAFLAAAEKSTLQKYLFSKIQIDLISYMVIILKNITISECSGT